MKFEQQINDPIERNADDVTDLLDEHVDLQIFSRSGMPTAHSLSTVTQTQQMKMAEPSSSWMHGREASEVGQALQVADTSEAVRTKMSDCDNVWRELDELVENGQVNICIIELEKALKENELLEAQLSSLNSKCRDRSEGGLQPLKEVQAVSAWLDISDKQGIKLLEELNEGTAEKRQQQSKVAVTKIMHADQTLVREMPRVERTDRLAAQYQAYICSVESNEAVQLDSVEVLHVAAIDSPSMRVIPGKHHDLLQISTRTDSNLKRNINTDEYNQYSLRPGDMQMCDIEKTEKGVNQQLNSKEQATIFNFVKGEKRFSQADPKLDELKGNLAIFKEEVKSAIRNLEHKVRILSQQLEESSNVKNQLEMRFLTTMEEKLLNRSSQNARKTEHISENCKITEAEISEDFVGGKETSHELEYVKTKVIGMNCHEEIAETIELLQDQVSALESALKSSEDTRSNVYERLEAANSAVCSYMEQISAMEILESEAREKISSAASNFESEISTKNSILVKYEEQVLSISKQNSRLKNAIFKEQVKGQLLLNICTAINLCFTISCNNFLELSHLIRSIDAQNKNCDLQERTQKTRSARSFADEGPSTDQHWQIIDQNHQNDVQTLINGPVYLGTAPDLVDMNPPKKRDDTFGFSDSDLVPEEKGLLIEKSILQIAEIIALNEEAEERLATRLNACDLGSLHFSSDCRSDLQQLAPIETLRNLEITSLGSRHDSQERILLLLNTLMNAETARTRLSHRLELALDAAESFQEQITALESARAIDKDIRRENGQTVNELANRLSRAKSELVFLEEQLRYSIQSSLNLGRNDEQGW